MNQFPANVNRLILWDEVHGAPLTVGEELSNGSLHHVCILGRRRFVKICLLPRRHEVIEHWRIPGYIPGIWICLEPLNSKQRPGVGKRELVHAFPQLVQRGRLRIVWSSFDSRGHISRLSSCRRSSPCHLGPSGIRERCFGSGQQRTPGQPHLGFARRHTSP